jgi:hypothetical protein
MQRGKTRKSKIIYSQNLFKMNEIKLFGKALNTKNLSPVIVNELAVSKGYVVHPDCCNDRVRNFLQSMSNNYNTTFYRSVGDVIGKSRFMLFIDQIMHYASTYGTEYAGTPYIPNPEFGAVVEPLISFEDCKVIAPITVEEISEKVCQMLYAGIALKGETIEALIQLIEEFEISVDIESVKNIEAKMHLYKRFNFLPTSPDEMVRYLVFLHTNNTLVIKDAKSISIIKNNPRSIESLVNAFGAEKLSSVFFRYKALFLAMKSDANKVIINKLRRLADKHHKPFVPGFWETVLSAQVNPARFMVKLPELSDFKKVRLIKAIDERKLDMTQKMYVIRNGKIHIEPSKSNYKSHHRTMRHLLIDSLVESLSKKACKIKLPDNIRLAIPSSQKTFVGNIPYGSYIMPSKENAVFGIVWKGEDGAQDLDLAYMTVEGDRIGWDSGYYSKNHDVVYSGDMTYANPEACEYMFCKKGLTDGVITVNAYNAVDNSKFNFFVGQTNDDFTVNHKTPSEDIIKFKAEMHITGETSIGFNIDGKIYFCDLNTGNSRISSFTEKTKNTLQYFIDTKDTFLYWDYILTAAGFEITDTDYEIDLSNGDIAQMISLLS